MNVTFSNDKYGMNWFRPDYEYAKVSCTEGLECKAETKKGGDVYRTKFVFTNCSDKPVFTDTDSIGIRFPLEDRYDGSDVCITSRCHGHIFCGKNVSYVMALRMGGEAPHLGMALTKGSLESYSVERDPEKSSNDRGCFILHPSPMELCPGESAVLEWVIFPHQGKEDFVKKLAVYSDYIEVKADRYVVFLGEKNRIWIRPHFPAKTVWVDGKRLDPDETGAYVLEYTTKECGEQVFCVKAGERQTRCRVLVQEPLEKLAARRGRFIVEKQQYEGKADSLRGAYLAYDNEEKHPVYRREYDYNGGRERVGMGLFLLRLLQGACREEEKKRLEESLERYTAYLKREIVHVDTGEVCNDFGMDNRYLRLYNFTWYATFFTERYQLYARKEDLETACRILEDFYSRGGAGFYPIELPVLSLNRALKKAGMEEERRRMYACFTAHGDRLLEIGLHYPSHEVNYEQSIVAPAANILLQTALLTGEEKYLEGGRRQLAVLEQFNGIQPDYHLYETAVRHWDGYWFGKRRLYGDTFPHYWSALTGNVYLLYAKASGDLAYLKKARDSLRGVLPLFFGDGTASCAYVFPHRVNGVRAAYYDPYANDQDWGLYFAIRFEQELGRNL